MRFVEVGEKQVYRVRKAVTPVFVMCVLIPVWLYFAWILAAPFLRALFSTGVKLVPTETYLAAMIAFLLMLPVLLLVALSYLGNRLVITDKRAYIRKGVGGACITVELHTVRSFQHAYTRGRNQGSDAILFYLKCGKVVRTGVLFARMSSLGELLELLRARFEGRGFTAAELKEMAASHTGERGYERRTSGLLLGLLLLPFALAAVLSVAYWL